MKSLRDIGSFGNPSAERDDLERFFISTPVFDELMTGRKHVVLGKKGSGKTALYSAVLREAPARKALAYGLTFKNYPWRVHAAYVDATGDRWERYQAPWRFLILVSIAALLIKEDTEGRLKLSTKATGDALKNLRRFVESHYGSMGYSYRKAFPKGGFEIDGINVAPAAPVDGGSGGMGSLGIRRGGLRHGDTIERLNEWLWTNLQELSSQCSAVFVLFDELDAGFDPDSDDYVDRVIGLLLAVRQLSFLFSRSKAPFHPIAFLRTDIYDALKFGDKGKLTQEDAVQLQWHDQLNHVGSSLKRLIDWRIQIVCELGSTDGEPWPHVFDAQVMRGTQHKFQHMTSRSYLRPRDVIQFSNFALDAAKKRLAIDRSSRQLILNQDVVAARDDYSKWFLEELDDEIGEADNEWQSYLEILRRIRYTRFSILAFEEAYRRTEAAESLEMSCEQTLRFFYEFSIVGFERFAGASGAEYHFRYLDEKVRLNPKARGFQVHFALKEALDLKDIGGPVDQVAW